MNATAEEMKLSHIQVDYHDGVSAGGDLSTYTSVALIGDMADDQGREWRCEHVLIAGEHWEPSVQRAVIAAEEKYGVETIDLRD